MFPSITPLRLRPTTCGALLRHSWSTGSSHLCGWMSPHDVNKPHSRSEIWQTIFQTQLTVFTLWSCFSSRSIRNGIYYVPIFCAGLCLTSSCFQWQWSCQCILFRFFDLIVNVCIFIKHLLAGPMPLHVPHWTMHFLISAVFLILGTRAPKWITETFVRWSKQTRTTWGNSLLPAPWVWDVMRCGYCSQVRTKSGCVLYCFVFLEALLLRNLFSWSKEGLRFRPFGSLSSAIH